MREQAAINKNAWEHRADEFLNARAGGTPAEVAQRMRKNPSVKNFHQQYFENINGEKIANICGSDGRDAIPLALLGGDVTVFDISEAFKRYTLELAKEAGVNIQYILGDFCDIDVSKYKETFDMIYAEGGILHYFSDINLFMKNIYTITKQNGQLILNDFHPFRKISDYFNTDLHERKVPCRGHFPEEEQDSFPKMLIRYYNLSEIINAVISSGFTLIEFNEHPSPDDEKTPGEFTIIAQKK